MHRSKIPVFPITYRRPVSRTCTPNPITSSSMKIGDLRPSVVADFTKRSVYPHGPCYPFELPSNQGGSRADSKMLQLAFRRGGLIPA